MVKIAYIGIDLFFPALQSLAQLGCEIEEIFTCETDNITEFNTEIIGFANRHKIKYTTKRITAEDISRLKAKGCRMAVCGGYYFRIPVDSEFPIVNIHPSLLPHGRGSWPMPISILRKEKVSGVTIHKVAEGFDTGDILIQESFPLSENENLKTFMEKACALVPDMMKKLVESFDELYENAVPQGAGEYLDAPVEKDWTVTEGMNCEEADLILRAFYGYECIYSGGGKKYIMLNARAVQNAECKQLPLTDGYVVAERILAEIEV